MLSVALVALGGAIGSVLRYLLMSRVSILTGHRFPWGTLAVNLLGSLAMGLCVGYLARHLPTSQPMRIFLAVGVLGGFTTFSTFSLDLVHLIQRDQVGPAMAYAASSCGIGVLALFAGLWVWRV